MVDKIFFRAPLGHWAHWTRLNSRDDVPLPVVPAKNEKRERRRYDAESAQMKWSRRRSLFSANFLGPDSQTVFD